MQAWGTICVVSEPGPDSGRIPSAFVSDRPADDGNLHRTERLSSFARTILDQIRARRRILAFPALVLAFLLAFTALGLSGSSSPLLSVDGGASDSVIVGTPRTIRSDEWIVHTPMVISQVENGAPRFGDVGVGSHDMSILSDLPVFDWLSVFHPNLWAYYVLPVDNAFAFDWWSVAAILLIGTYFFLYVLLRSIRWSIAGALLLYGSPFFHWWYTSSVFTSVGWMAFAMACLILAVSSTGVRRAVLVGLTAYAVVCFALIIYPPWQIAAAIAIAAVTLGALWASWRHSSVSIRSILGSSAVAGGLALLPLLAFYVTRRPAIQAIGQTVYPGSRVVGGGTFPWTQLSSGWFGMSYVRNGPAIRGLLFPMNQKRHRSCSSGSRCSSPCRCCGSTSLRWASGFEP